MSLRRLNRRQFAIALESEETRGISGATPEPLPTDGAAAPEVPAVPGVKPDTPEVEGAVVQEQTQPGPNAEVPALEDSRPPEQREEVRGEAPAEMPAAAAEVPAAVAPTDAAPAADLPADVAPTDAAAPAADTSAATDVTPEQPMAEPVGDVPTDAASVDAAAAPSDAAAPAEMPAAEPAAEPAPETRAEAPSEPEVDPALEPVAPEVAQAEVPVDAAAPAADAPAAEVPPVDAGGTVDEAPAAAPVDAEVSQPQAEMPGEAPAMVEPAAAAPETEAPPVEAPTFSAAELIRRAQVRAAGEDPDATPDEAPANDVEAPATAAVEPADVSAEVPIAPAVQEPAIAEEDLVMIDDEGDAADAFMNEACDEEERMDELEGEVQTAEDAHRRLGSLADVIETAAENGGLSTDGARMMEIAVEAVYASLGMDRPIGIPAMESFTTVAGKIGAAQVALETVQETAKNVMVKIVEAFKKAFEWLSQFMHKVFTATGRLRARAEKIKEASKGLAAAHPKSMEVGNANLAKAMTINGQLVKSPAQFIHQANAFCAAAFGPKTHETFKLAEQAIGFLKGAAKSGDQHVLDKSAEDFMKLAESAVNMSVSVGMRDYHGSASDFGGEEPGEGQKIVTSPVFLGDKMIWAVVPAAHVGLENIQILAGYKTGLAELRSSAEPTAALKTLPASEIIKIADAVIEFANVAEKYKSMLAEAKKMNDMIMGLASGISAGSGANLHNEETFGGIMKTMMKTIMIGVRTGRALVKGIHQPAMAMGATIANVSLEYAALSLKAYAGAEAPAGSKALPAPAHA